MITYWSLELSNEPTDSDLEAIAEMVKQGYTSGHYVGEEDEE